MTHSLEEEENVSENIAQRSECANTKEIKKRRVEVKVDEEKVQEVTQSVNSHYPLNTMYSLLNPFYHPSDYSNI